MKAETSKVVEPNEVTETGGSTEPVEVAAKPKGHQRAGITTNKGHGQSKTRRQMAARSRRINRRK